MSPHKDLPGIGEKEREVTFAPVTHIHIHQQRYIRREREREKERERRTKCLEFTVCFKFTHSSAS